MSNPFDELNNKLKDQETKLTKREYFAVTIMSGIVADGIHSYGTAVESTVQLTDKLIAELNKPRSK